jgi:membrane protein
MDTLKKLLRCFNQSVYVTVVNHDGIEHAGYLAFVALVAIFPFLVLLVAIGGVIGQGEVGAKFIEILLTSLPHTAQEGLRPRIDEILSGPPQGLLTIAILGAIWTSSSMVEGLRTILNRTYRVATPPAYLLRRLISIGQLLIFAFVVIIGMTLLVFVPMMIEEVRLVLHVQFQGDGVYWNNMILTISAFAMFVMVASMYYFIPNIKQTLLAVIPGAAITVILWAGAAGIFSYYLTHFKQVSLIYGSLGGIIATLFFFYIINLIFILGAELNYQLCSTFGWRMEEKIFTVKRTD